MFADRCSNALQAIPQFRRTSRAGRARGPVSTKHLSQISEETMTSVKTIAQSLQRVEFAPERSTPVARRPGDLKDGRQLGPYRLVERLGQGGQGEVWKAQRLGPPGELVALKILKPELAHNPTRMAQFRREAQRGLRLTGRSLLAAYELSEIDGFHCMTMPFILGTALRDVIKWRISYLSGEETEHNHPFVGMEQAEYRRAIAAALAEAASALAMAHQRRIAHRDIKPANLLLENRPDGRVYLCDFGLGRDLDVATCEQMRDGAGTPIYMAPERLLMFTADEIKCDIYSMGVTLFEALLLEKPFRVPAHVTGPSIAPYLATTAPKPVRRIEDDFPVELEEVITKAMARNPARRFESAGDLADSLQEFVTNSRPANCKSALAKESRLTLRGPHARSRRVPAFPGHSDADLG
jgi:eukaryotic-like serine/threonine-protein kinase